MGFCECTAKFLLFTFNLVCALLGLVIIGFSVATNIHGKPFQDILHGQINVVSIVLIVIGVLIFLIAFLGCCGAVRESHCMLTTYAVILSMLLIIQIAIGITSFVYRNKLEDNLNEIVKKSFDNPSTEDFIDEIQIDLKCCGLDGPSFWSVITKGAPASCCGYSDKNKKCPATEVYTDGCGPKMKDIIMKSLQLLGGIAIGIAIIELICVIFAFCLTSSFKKMRRDW